MNAGALAGLIKGVRYPTAEVTGGCEQSLWVLGSKLKSSRTAALFPAEPSFHPSPLCFLMNLSFF